MSGPPVVAVEGLGWLIALAVFASVMLVGVGMELVALRKEVGMLRRMTQHHLLLAGEIEEKQSELDRVRGKVEIWARGPDRARRLARLNESQ